MTASAASSPVRSASARSASSMQTPAASRPKPASTAAMASPTASRAAVAAASCRRLTSAAAFGSRFAVPNSPATASDSGFRLAASLAHRRMVCLKQGASRLSSNRPASSARSCLLKMASAGRPSHRRAISMSASVTGPPASNTASTSPASSSFFQLRRMPSASMASASSLPRTPAVSNRFSRMSPSCTACSTTSRVVPATGVTIARSNPASRLSSVLLPTLGRPSSTQSTPWRSTAPAL